MESYKHIYLYFIWINTCTLPLCFHFMVFYHHWTTFPEWNSALSTTSRPFDSLVTTEGSLWMRSLFSLLRYINHLTTLYINQCPFLYNCLWRVQSSSASRRYNRNMLLTHSCFSIIHLMMSCVIINQSEEPKHFHVNTNAYVIFTSVGSLTCNEVVLYGTFTPGIPGIVKAVKGSESWGVLYSGSCV